QGEVPTVLDLGAAELAAEGERLEGQGPRLALLRESEEAFGSRKPAVLLEPLHRERIVACGGAIVVPRLGERRVDSRAAVHNEPHAADRELEGQLVVVRMAPQASLAVRAGGDHQV